MKNPGSNYVPKANRSHHPPHNIKHEELNELFIGVGWMGKRRKPALWLKSILRNDRGPGLVESRR